MIGDVLRWVTRVCAVEFLFLFGWGMIECQLAAASLLIHKYDRGGREKRNGKG